VQTVVHGLLPDEVVDLLTQLGSDTSSRCSRTDRTKKDSPLGNIPDNTAITWFITGSTPAKRGPISSVGAAAGAAPEDPGPGMPQDHFADFDQLA
jgi:hypothetical protein